MGIEDIRPNGMMAYLLDVLSAKKDIGHYGRLVFAKVARHFVDADELVAYLTQNPGLVAFPASEPACRIMVR